MRVNTVVVLHRAAGEKKGREEGRKEGRKEGRTSSHIAMKNEQPYRADINMSALIT